MSIERTLSADFLAAIAAGVVRPVLFLYADFPSGARRLWSGPYDVSYESNTWQGRGDLLKLANVVETTDTGAQGMTVQLNGCDDATRALFVAGGYKGRVFELRYSFWNSTRTSIFAPSKILWRGILQNDNIKMGRKSIDIAVNCENRLSDILRRRAWMYSDADQQLLYASAGSITPTSLRTNMQAWWELGNDNDSHTTGRNYTLTEIDTPTFHTSPSRVSIDTSTGALEAQSADINADFNNGDFSVAGYFKGTEALGGGDPGPTICGRWSHTQQQFLLQYYQFSPTDRIILSVKNGSGTEFLATWDFGTTGALLNTEHFFALGVDRSGSQFWLSIDGGTKVTESYTGLLANTSTAFLIGSDRDRNTSNGPFRFRGDLRRFTTWTRSISQVEVAAMWNGGTGMSYADTAGVVSDDLRDTAFEHITNIQDKTIPWGRTATK